MQNEIVFCIERECNELRNVKNLERFWYCCIMKT